MLGYQGSAAWRREQERNMKMLEHANDNEPATARTEVEPFPANPVVGGWEGRSDSSAFKRYVIFEVGDDIVRQQAFKAWAVDQGLPFKALLGKWKGQQAHSFMVEDTSTNRLKLAYWLIGQQAVLCLGPAYRDGPVGKRLYGNRLATLDWLEGDGYTVREREPLDGTFQTVQNWLALDSWTYDPITKEHYAVV